MERNNPSKSTIENANCLNKIWKYNLVDSFRILNPKLGRYSYIKKRQRFQNVENQIEILESKDVLIESQKDLNHLKEILITFEKEKSEGYRIRSRLPHFEVEEPNISYYSKLEKVNTEKNLLYALYDPKDNSILKRGTENVLKIMGEFYGDLYTKQNCDEIIQKELLNSINKSIS